MLFTRARAPNSLLHSVNPRTQSTCINEDKNQKPEASVPDPDLRIHMLLGLPDPDPLVIDTDPDPSIIKQK